MEKLRIFLDSNNIGIVNFAKRLGVTQPQLSKWINGVGRPNLEHILLIEELSLGVITPKDWAKKPVPKSQ